MDDRRLIRRGTATAMIITAILFDVLQWFVTMIPLVGFLLSPLVTLTAWIVFGLWFAILRASVVRYSPLAYFGLLPIEFVPLLNLFPATFMMVSLSIHAANRKGV